MERTLASYLLHSLDEKDQILTNMFQVSKMVLISVPQRAPTISQQGYMWGSVRLVASKSSNKWIKILKILGKIQMISRQCKLISNVEEGTKGTHTQR